MGNNKILWKNVAVAVEFVPYAKSSFGTHDGSFHSDEVTACAILLLVGLIDRGKSSHPAAESARGVRVCLRCRRHLRSKDQTVDHHQADYQGEMSSAGMIWLYLKDQKIIDEPTYHFFNDSLASSASMRTIMDGWSTDRHCSFSQIVSDFVPVVLTTRLPTCRTRRSSKR